MFEWIQRIWAEIFTNEKFPDQGRRNAVGGKKIGEVYDVQYMPSPENPGEMLVVFAKKDDEEQ